MANNAITSLPGQQPPPEAGEIEQQQQSNNIPQAVSTNNGQNWHSSSGSIGPFFGVISVLTVLANLSCILGRIFQRRAEAAAVRTPSEPPRIERFFGWMKRCRGGDVELGAKVVAVGDQEKQDCKSKDGEIN